MTFDMVNLEHIINTKHVSLQS